MLISGISDIKVRKLMTVCILRELPRIISLMYLRTALGATVFLELRFRHRAPRRVVTVTTGAKRALAETGGVPTQLPQTVVAVVGCEPRLGTRPAPAVLPAFSSTMPLTTRIYESYLLISVKYIRGNELNEPGYTEVRVAA